MKKNVFLNFKGLYKIVSIILCLVLFIEATPFLAFAEVNNENQTVVKSSDIDDRFEPPVEVGEGELEYGHLQMLKPENVERPETISLEKAIECGHVNRLFRQEKDLRTVMFQNKNGSETTYIYDKPVKYIDSCGSVRDKVTTLTPTDLPGYAYAMTQNSFQTYFGKTASTGLKIDYQNCTFTMKPKTSLLVSTPVLSDDEKSIVYTGAFGANTALRYQTQLSGVKEDIILMSDIGKYSFEFLLTTVNVIPMVTEDAQWVLLNDEGEHVADFGSILIRDSSGKHIYGSLEIVSHTVGGYIMTITVPQEFLRDSSTVYPVYIDPTIIIDETDFFVSYEGSEMIETEYATIVDVGLYKSESFYNSAISNTDQHILSKNQGKVVYKFFDFFNEEGQFYNLSPYRIGRATVHFTSVAQSRATYYIHPMTAYVSDLVYAVNSSSLFDSFSETVSTSEEIILTYGDTFAMDITEIVRGWAGFNMGYSSAEENDPANGFVLSQGETLLGDDWLYSTEATGDNNVYYEIVTSDIGGLYAVRNKESGRYMVRQRGKEDLGGRSVIFDDAVTASSIHEGAYWIISYHLNGKYMISHFSKQGYTLDSLVPDENSEYEDFDNRLAPIPNVPTNEHYWSITYASGGGAILKNFDTGTVLSYERRGSGVCTPILVGECSSSSSDYSKTVWFLTKLNDQVVRKESFVRTDEMPWINVNGTYTPAVTVEPANTSFASRTDFYWFSEDRDVASVDENGVITGLKNGYTYITIENKGNGESIKFPIVVGQLVPNDKYRIKNVKSEKYLDHQTLLGSMNEPLCVDNRDDSKQQTWEFSYLGSGYYKIKTWNNWYVNWLAHTSELIGAMGGGFGNQAVWFLEIGEFGNYRFVPQAAMNTEYALTTSEVENDFGVYLRDMTDSTDPYDEWVIERDHEVSIIAIPETYDRSSYFDTVTAQFEDMGYTDIYADEVCMSKEALQSYIENSEIFIVRTHGSPRRITASNGEWGCNYRYVMPNVSFVGVNLVVYGACSTGGVPEDGHPSPNIIPKNLVQLTVEEGAKTAVGFTCKVTNIVVNEWCVAFVEALGEGMTVREAGEEACNAAGIPNEYLLICGDAEAQFLKSVEGEEA